MRYFILLLLTLNVTLAQIPLNSQEWQRKQNREEIARALNGDPQKAIANMTTFLADHPDDAEVMFGLALAHSMMGEIEQAWNWCKSSVHRGLPLERYLAGPREELEPLVSSQQFNSYFDGTLPQLLHGPMLGNITGHSTSVWLRTAEQTTVRIEYSKDPHFEISQKSIKLKTLQETDYTQVLPLTGLEPQTLYYYRCLINGKPQATIHQFQTVQQKELPGTFTIAWGGCAAYNPEFEHIWDTIHSHNPNALLLLGDNVYIDHPESPGTNQFCYYQRQSSPAWKNLTASTPIYTIWDDHDFGINDDFGGPHKNTPAWKVMALDVFKQNWVNPYYSHDAETPGIWYDFKIGDVQFFMLDCRYYRQPSTDENPSMLGPIQKQWLKDKLKASTATFKVIGSSVPWADGAKGWMDGRIDTWRGYANERDEIFTFLTQNHINGVLLLSADRHRSDAWLHERQNDYPLWEFENSRLTNIHYHQLMPGALWGYNKTCMFGLFEFDTTLPDPTLVYKVINSDNKLIHQITLYRSQLQSPACE